MHRRTLLLAGAAALTVRAIPAATAATEADYVTVRLSDAEWRARLSPAAYKVLRKESTERAFTSPLLNEKRSGTFDCAGCALPLYASETKYDSGTGWPSFWQALPDAVRTKPDRVLIVVRTEVHCRRCGGHLGHIFDDGPAPTGKRHCINGVALAFTPA